MGKKSREKKERKGGPNPGAVPRKTLVGLPPGQQLVAAIKGIFSDTITEVGNAMAVLREFQLRFRRPLKPGVQTTFGHGSTGKVRFAVGPDGEAEAQALAMRATFAIGQWITSATPEDIRVLAKFLECRPIEPNKEDRGALWPRWADPAALKVAVEAGYSEEESKFPPGTRFVMSKQEVLDRCTDSRLDERTLRRVAQELSQKKGEPGRPKSDG